MSDELTLEVRGLKKSYGAVTALEELTYSARAGEIVGFLGPNGAGKTTTIRVLTTILAPTAGSFSVVGIPHTRPAEIRARIGVLPESAGYPESQTGEEFLTYHGQLFGLSRANARSTAAALLGEVGLEERASWPISAYSRGMKQRLGIARALVNEPSVVFFDEPTLGLDPAGQRQVLRLIQAIARERGATVVLSTHFLAEVEETCTRVLILGRGRVVAEGTVAEVSRRAAAPRQGRFRVPAEQRATAVDALAGVAGVASAEAADSQPDWVTITLDEGPDPTGGFQRQVTAAIGALSAAGVPLLGFELEGARLSDAFLSVTEVG
jgi:ABC-2 type transport system ATP-binding protein